MKIARMSEIRKLFEDPEKEITIDESAKLLEEAHILYNEIHDSLSGILFKTEGIRSEMDGQTNSL